MSLCPKSERPCFCTGALALGLIVGTCVGTCVGTWLSAGAAAAADKLPVDQVYEAKDLICDFYHTDSVSEYMSLLGAAPRADLFMVMEDIRRELSTARAVIGRGARARPLKIYEGEAGLHFVEDREASVVVTTLVSCSRWKRKGGRNLCTRFDALNAWHFDASVHQDPDRAFHRLGTSSYRGSCEPWKMP